jgi:predicted nucleic acid-binding protein
MVLVDANVLLDIITSDRKWFDWSVHQLERALTQGIAINPVIYAELAAGFHKSAELETALGLPDLERLPLPFEAAFRAGRVFVEYRRRGGDRRSPLPDFFVGAHAETAGMSLLTRDTARYRTYFPKVRLIAPE